MNPLDGMSFGQALQALRDGRRATRMAWGKPEAFVYLEKGSHAPIESGMLLSIEGIGADLFEVGDTGTVTRLPNISFQGTTKNIVRGWVPSQSDLLADDWYIPSQNIL